MLKKWLKKNFNFIFLFLVFVNCSLSANENIEQVKQKNFTVSINLLDPILKSIFLYDTFFLNDTNPTMNNRAFSPSLEVNCQYLVHPYISLSFSWVVNLEVINNPFYNDFDPVIYFTDSNYVYDTSVAENLRENIFFKNKKNFLNTHFVADISMKILPFGKGLHNYKGLYFKVGFFMGASIFDNIYMSKEDISKIQGNVESSGKIDSSKISYLYPIYGEKSTYFNNLVSFLAGVKAGIGWQFIFKNGFFLDLGVDVSYDGKRKVVVQKTKNGNEEVKKMLTGFNWYGNIYIGYSW